MVGEPRKGRIVNSPEEVRDYALYLGSLNAKYSWDTEIFLDWVKRYPDLRGTMLWTTLDYPEDSNVRDMIEEYLGEDFQYVVWHHSEATRWLCVTNESVAVKLLLVGLAVQPTKFDEWVKNRNACK